MGSTGPASVSPVATTRRNGARAPLARAPKDVRLGLALGCGLAACNTSDGKLAARALAIIPPARRARVIQACIDHGVLLPLDLITPAKP